MRTCVAGVASLAAVLAACSSTDSGGASSLVGAYSATVFQVALPGDPLNFPLPPAGPD